MLTARAYTLRQKSRLAISLSWIAGYTNVQCLIYCGVMTSHVTGNATHLAQHLAELFKSTDAWISALFCFWLVFTFWLGAVLSGIMMQTARRHQVRSQYIFPMAVEAGLLMAVSICVELVLSRPHQVSTILIYFMTGAATMAMGLQNATITQVSGSVVRTTHLTGVTTDIGTDLVQYFLWLRDKTRGRGRVRWRRAMRATLRNPTAHRLALLYTILMSFLLGVVIGGVVSAYVPALGLVPPVLFLAAIIYIDWYQPIADVKELDHVHDPELKAHGIEKSMLPPGLLICRVAPRLSGTQHHAPNFSAWADDLPRGIRVVILSLYHHMHFDGDVALDLQATIQKLAAEDRRLILAGVVAQHYQILDDHGVTAHLDMQDLCPDLEFAVARAIDVLGTLKK